MEDILYPKNYNSIIENIDNSTGYAKDLTRLEFPVFNFEEAMVFSKIKNNIVAENNNIVDKINDFIKIDFNLSVKYYLENFKKYSFPFQEWSAYIIFSSSNAMPFLNQEMELPYLNDNFKNLAKLMTLKAVDTLYNNMFSKKYVDLDRKNFDSHFLFLLMFEENNNVNNRFPVSKEILKSQLENSTTFKPNNNKNISIILNMLLHNEDFYIRNYENINIFLNKLDNSIIENSFSLFLNSNEQYSIEFYTKSLVKNTELSTKGVNKIMQIVLNNPPLINIGKCLTKVLSENLSEKNNFITTEAFRFYSETRGV